MDGRGRPLPRSLLTSILRGFFPHEALRRVAHQWYDCTGFGLGGKDLSGRRNWNPSIPLRERKHPKAENRKTSSQRGVTHSCIAINYLPASIAAQSSPLLRVSRNSTRRRASKTNQIDARIAGRPARPAGCKVAATAATLCRGKCSAQRAAAAADRQKCRSNREVTNRFIAGIASKRSAPNAG